MPEVVSEVLFLRRIAADFAIDGELEPLSTPWLVGFDSALMVELVLFIEDLGVDLTEDVDWGRATFRDIYSAYAIRAALSDGPAP